MRNIFTFLVIAALVSSACSALAIDQRFASPSQDALLTAARNGDIARVSELLKAGSGSDGRDARGNTALHWAALNNNVDLVALLLRAGAGANATNHAGATPLIYGAGDARVVAELLAQKADPNAVSALGTTPLHSASARGGSAQVVELLLGHGADPNAPNRLPLTPLTLAPLANDLTVVELLVKHGAYVNPTNQVTPLMTAAFAGNLAVTRFLLDHEADPRRPGPFAGHALNVALYAWQTGIAQLLIQNGADVQSPSPIGDQAPPVVWAAYSDLADPVVVRLLQEKGVDLNQQTASGENALAWALKRGSTPLVQYLRQSGVDEIEMIEKQKERPNRSLPEGREALGQIARAAAQKAVDQLQRGSDGFLRNGFVRQANCVSCHHQTFPAVAYQFARERGLSLDEGALARQVERQIRSWEARIDFAYEASVAPQPDAPNNLGFGLIGLHALGYAPDDLTDAHARYLLAVQNPAGYWPSHERRPPSSDGPIMGTALTLRAIQLYPVAALEDQTAERVARARRWLLEQEARTHNERVFQLLGLVWAGEGAPQLRPLAARILSEQRPDGGWAQLPGLESDAWATGQALVALEEAGALTIGSPAHQRGLKFLLRTQFDDGSWWVRSRAWPFQPHFDSGFPHGKDQWVSAAGTTWAVIALLKTLPLPAASAQFPTAQALVAKHVGQAELPMETTPLPFPESSDFNFQNDIWPLLERSCAGCHTGEKAKGRFRVETRESVLEGGQSRDPAVIPGNAAASPLLRYVKDQVEDLEMPPLARRAKYPALTEKEVEQLRDWIASGAP
jgi:ankyrin repeat protein